MHSGSCLCGAVKFEVAGPLPLAIACHCSMCRKQSGHFWVSTEVARTALTGGGGDDGSDGVAWRSVQAPVVPG